MQSAPIPADDAKRVLTLHSAQILDTPQEELFDRITRLASRLLNTPIALISLVDANRQWFKSKVGLDTTETPRDISFCGHAVLQEQPFVINDALEDPRFADNPLVVGPPYIRFYGGIPLLSIERHAIGVLCVIDHQPRVLNTQELSTLVDLARMAEELFQRRELALASNSILESLRDSEARYRQLIERSPDAFLIHDGQTIEFINQAGIQLLAAESSDSMIGRTFYDIVAPEYHNIVQRHIALALNHSHPTHALPTTPHELKWIRLDGTLLDVEMSTICLTIQGRRVIQVIARDNTLRKQYRQELEQLSTQDILTGLPNRAVLMDRLEQGIARWGRNNQEAIIAFVNLDHFKQINDTYGHSIGDQVLTTIAKTLLRSIRQNDTVARVGSDEFILILDTLENDEEPNIVLQRLFASICQPFLTTTQEMTVSCSIGYCHYPDDGTTADALLNAADAAMYRAKALGRSTISAYSADMQSKLTERMTLESRLRLAVKQNELVLHYQPKVDLKTGSIVGLEALVRWQHPEMGLISPMRFIPIAEETGLIVPMGEWILRTACEQILMWQREGIASMPVAVNLSARQFLQPDIVARIKDIVESTGLDPSFLELELTESLSMDSPEKSIAILVALKELGITLTLDDFGTGYSNLSYLKRFPLDKLKLDQSFVRDITQSNEALAISQAIIALAHSLRLTIVAEGVETHEQLALLTHYHCDEMQGYLFSKPLPVAQCTALLQSNKKLENI
ncbi:MAG: EAL domain-containing protein [Pseudomonadota bacterium]